MYKCIMVDILLFVFFSFVPNGRKIYSHNTFIYFIVRRVYTNFEEKWASSENSNLKYFIFEIRRV